MDMLPDILPDAMARPREAYLRYLREDCGYPYVEYLPGGQKWAAVYPLAFTGAIITGTTFDRVNIENRWCFESVSAALAALLTWLDRGAEGEPEGWHRAPHDGRRRPDGDASREYREW